ncbi:hypothetical protein HMPREF0026_02622 [Acinetobacter junii SH205]|jgi:hypothetical protein|uniref:Uncharacterized protein n=10 Tax=Bacteria TaxID=2 RepID=A0A380U959_ACIJO|nr:hypothetical protein HMPREF0026_02622 [Acinetobacter junii SH205]SSI41893.1 Uncharacterised protein [Acinetobacter baumannii]SST85401.1 Uncharacterised protein [Acinetobacter baumannii]SSU77793.1 Uncharacterised protein [Acinetobacter baumannii]SUU00170.1 Uncharacterised protein [Acinetobacter johnsonii]|eukprot:TRINITY_DN35829_c0_g1_i1.p1 TRINITY_DN35829_c0_g1~~TRINITY_DN35829_c0_g1_i1.p1  ORF type:complete len:137 (+),score=7.86 TRINITY_DN35829_c0_g1_i1:111-521(+)
MLFLRGIDLCALSSITLQKNIDIHSNIHAWGALRLIKTKTSDAYKKEKMMMFKTFLKTALISSLLAGASLAQAGWFAQASESYLVQARHTGGGVYQCLYKTNPGNRGWRNFTVNFQGGCPRFVHFNAQNGQVTVPN